MAKYFKLTAYAQSEIIGYIRSDCENAKCKRHIAENRPIHAIPPMGKNDPNFQIHYESIELAYDALMTHFG
jgi:hypothetical protein